MRRSTSLMAAWGVAINEGERLSFEKSKGGSFSSLDEFGLQVMGKTALSGTPLAEAPADIQCVKSGTKLLCRGKNLFNKNESTVAALKNESAGGFWGTDPFPAGYDLRKIFPVGETVTLSFDVECVSAPEGYKTTPSGARVGFSLLGTSITAHTWTWFRAGETAHHSFTFTVPQSLDGVTLRVYSNRYTVSGEEADTHAAYGQMIFRNVQVELGDTETPYEPYYESEITVPCDLRQGDKWYPATGKVVRKTAHVTVTEENSLVKQTINARTFYYTVLSGAPQGDIDFFGVCDRFTTGKYIDTLHGTCDARFGSSAFVFAFDAENASEVKAWLATHPVNIVYALGTPRIENYPPQPMSSPCGTVNVTSLPRELSPDLSAAMLVKF